MRPVIANRRPGSGSIDSTIPSSEIHRAIAPSLTANFPFLLTLRLGSRQQGNARRSEATVQGTQMRGQKRQGPLGRAKAIAAMWQRANEGRGP